MRVRVKHRTVYGYDREAAFGPHVIRLRPAEHTRARLLSYNLQVEPEGSVRWQYDPWGNRIARVSWPAGTTARELAVTVDCAFDIRPVNPFDFFIDDRCQQVPFVYPDGLDSELAPFLSAEKPGPLLEHWLSDLPETGHTTSWLVALNTKVKESLRYLIRQEAGIQTPEETLEKGSGSCRDFALLMVAILRAKGLAARFASGYAVQLTDEGNIPDLAKGVAQDVVDLHAWAEVYVPGAGWIGLDGTSGLLCGEGHIPLACTVSPELAAPIFGTSSEPSTRFEFSMEVQRLGREPRPRKPYTEEEWNELCAVGRHVDAALQAAGVGLTTGGEPTWTSREHPREPEWNTEALGPTKWSQGLRMAREILKRFGHGPLLIQRMGKHYPGESLPRWALHTLWRTDDVPVWRDPALLDTGAPRGWTADGLHRALEDAQAFGAALCERLALPFNLIPGYEDPWVHIMEEENLPEGVDPLKYDLEDTEERRRLAHVLARGLATARGYALPLFAQSGHWVTSRWTFRRTHMFLVPGDAPMGLRLPLGRIGGNPPEQFDPDMTEGPGPLKFDPRQARLTREGGRSAGPGGQDAYFGSHRTALVVEPRAGVMHVFVPPLPNTEDFLALIAAIEDVAADRGQAVAIEGYPPGHDPRLQSCLVTPDPGVLEVNLPVCHSFDEYRTTMETLADAANHAGLCTEKYQVDGRESGSGGGNHLTLGGATTLSSPFLLRPDLMASILRYFQNHPSLSYFFSGLFVGPTSQAPRVDEARHDGLYELELALDRMAPGTRPFFPWFTDRMLRNLLVDLAGNTHRTELCIDKMYSPAGPTGRLGIVEFRGFEMPPHERMAAAQVLLLRALTAHLAKAPCTRPLVRFGSLLHDKYMLPHYMWQDLADVVRDLREGGLAVDVEWFRPFLDYRFPVLGTQEVDGLHLELRSALEPWPVLGEEATGATVTRYVDSSLERLQVRVDGLTDGRHVVLVNGHRLPLRPTGRAGEGVAGVRFRAWQPPHCLQPHIGLHHPLQFDLVDTWGKRSLGACRYHVWHPDGRAYDQPPLTAFEAAARRAQRFTTIGHLPYPVRVREAATPGEQPYTLDLRAFAVDRPRPPEEPEEVA